MRRDPHPAVDEDRQRQQRVSRRSGEVEVEALAEGPVKAPCVTNADRNVRVIYARYAGHAECAGGSRGGGGYEAQTTQEFIQDTRE